MMRCLRRWKDAWGEYCEQVRSFTQIEGPCCPQFKRWVCLSRPWQIVHLAGLEQADAVRAAYAKFPDVRVKVMDYCDDMASLCLTFVPAIAAGGALHL